MAHREGEGLDDADLADLRLKDGLEEVGVRPSERHHGRVGERRPVHACDLDADGAV